MNKEWNNALTTGHMHIDQHHEELFHLTSLLDNAIRSCRTSNLEDVICFLEKYVIDHFSEEENLMISNDFEYFNAHKEEHAHFAKWVSKIRQSFNTKNSSAHLIFELRKLIDDLIRHIKTIDVLLSGLKKDNS
jgi:hemerythrin-like metal-binding protein